MFKSLNPKRAYLNQLITKEKLLWKSKIEDELFWEQTATMFEEKFYQLRGLSDLKQRLNRLKETKVQIIEIDLTFFVSSCWLLNSDSLKRNLKAEY